MAKDLDGLPDLAGILQRVLNYLFGLKPTRSSPTYTDKNETLITETAPVSADYQANRGTDDVRDADKATVERKSLTPPHTRTKPASPRRLSNHLKDRHFLKQAIIVNELLQKPVALRRKSPIIAKTRVL